jgi:hypothetical protein
MNTVELNSIRKINTDFEKRMDKVFNCNILNYNINIDFQKDDNNFLTEIFYLTNAKKKFSFKYLLYHHPQLSLVFISQLYFENKNEISNHIKRFSLRDYAIYRKITFDVKLMRHPINYYEESVIIANKIFDVLERVLLLEEMQNILFTNYWIDVPFDYSQIDR